MKAAVWQGPEDLQLIDVPDPAPGPGEVIVAVRVAGLCGTDLHIASGKMPRLSFPMIAGHEFAGEVLDVGPGVTGIAPGARVAVDPSLFCGHCPECRRGRGNLCQSWGALGATTDGAFAERVRVPAANVYALPDGMSFAAGALAEPVSCAVHGVRRAGLRQGESVLIVGAGTMGLLLLQLCRRGGATSVTVVDSNPDKHALATRLGATVTAASVEDLDGERFDVAIDATGAPQAIEGAFASVNRGGRLLIFGVASVDAKVSLPPFRIFDDEITVVGSMSVLNSFGPAIDAIHGGAIATEEMVSHTFPLERFPEALDRLRGGDAVKVQISADG